MNYINVGKIVNTHGIKGELRILSKFKFKNKVFKKDMIIYIGNNKDKEVINYYNKLLKTNNNILKNEGTNKLSNCNNVQELVILNEFW